MNSLPEALKSGFITLLQRHLPGRTKRLIFLASFSARLKESTSLDMETLNKLNKVMVLASSPDAIKLPVQLSKAIWHNRSSFEICHEDLRKSILTTDCIQHIAQRVIRVMPVWLRYADDVSIQQDVTKLLDNRQTALGL